jgi:hypothetical protein
MAMTTKAELLKRIRQNCGECMGKMKGYSYPAEDVEQCSALGRQFYDFRFGKDPYPSRSGKPSNFSINRPTDGNFLNENQR